jgi:hypothetical protein
MPLAGPVAAALGGFADSAYAGEKLNPPSPTNLTAQSRARGISRARRGLIDLGHRRYCINPTLPFAGPRAATLADHRAEPLAVKGGAGLRQDEFGASTLFQASAARPRDDTSPTKNGYAYCKS